MQQEVHGTYPEERRRFVRVPYAGAVQYSYGTDESGLAEGHDVGREGLRVSMGRYLRPGTRVMVRLPGTTSDDNPVELKATVAWCRASGSRHGFLAGFRVIQDELDTHGTMAALVYDAVLSGDGPEGSSSERRAFPAQAISRVHARTCFAWDCFTKFQKRAAGAL